jgi:hypothetical protein
VELRASDRTQIVLHYVAAAIEFFELSRGIALPRARRLTRKLLAPDADREALVEHDGPHTMCAAALHVSAFRERCRQVVRSEASPEHALDQVLAIAIDHACHSCGQLNREILEERSHAR